MDPITQYILNEMKKPDVLYHAASLLTKTLKPRVTKLFIMSKSDASGRKAIFASHNKLYAFGIERTNMMIPHFHTEKQVNSWKSACWLKPEPPKLIVHYWNYIPRKKFYLYHVDSKGFKEFVAKTPNTTTTHWYIDKEIVPLRVEVINPRDIEGIAWKRATKKQWEEKKAKYKARGLYKR